MRDLTSESPGSLCFDPTLTGAPRLRLRRRDDPDGDPIVCDGRVIACPRWIQPTFDAMAECAEHGRDLVLLRASRITAVIRSHHRPAATALRRTQFARHADGSAALELAKALVMAKTTGQIAVLRRAARLRDDSELAERADRCARDRDGIGRQSDADRLRGLEGIIARQYFGGWPRMLGLPSFQRIPRRALNPINHLLDICYSRLCLLVTLHLLDAGFDLALGTLHVDDDRRPTLALDLMEPLRPLIADRFVLGCYRDALDAGWFHEAEGRWWLTPLGQRRFRDRWTTWIHGGSRRSGQIGYIQDTLVVYRAWLNSSTDLPFPAYTG